MLIHDVCFYSVYAHTVCYYSVFAHVVYFYVTGLCLLSNKLAVLTLLMLYVTGLCLLSNKLALLTFCIDSTHSWIRSQPIRQTVSWPAPYSIVEWILGGAGAAKSWSKAMANTPLVLCKPLMGKERRGTESLRSRFCLGAAWMCRWLNFCWSFGAAWHWILWNWSADAKCS